jgi:hypothetical protein
MATVDRVSGDWFLKSLGGNIYIDAAGGTGTTSIFGNLVVIGSQTNIGSIETLISDNIITLSANVTSGEPVLNAGIEVRRGDQPTVGFRWNEEVDRWQATADGSFWGNLMIRVKDDPDPHLGGNLYVDGYEIRSDANVNIVLNPGYSIDSMPNAGIEIKQIDNDLAPVSGATVVSARAPGNGHAGLYVTNTKSNNEELITKRKAVIYSLVL